MFSHHDVNIPEVSPQLPAPSPDSSFWPWAWWSPPDPHSSGSGAPVFSSAPTQADADAPAPFLLPVRSITAEVSGSSTYSTLPESCIIFYRWHLFILHTCVIFFFFYRWRLTATKTVAFASKDSFAGHFLQIATGDHANLIIYESVSNGSAAIKKKRPKRERERAAQMKTSLPDPMRCSSKSRQTL